MQYTTLTRKEIDGKRHYITPVGDFPSVTTILSATAPADKEATLEAWRQRIGVEEAERITQFSCDAGTVMHENLEMFNDPTITHDHSHFGTEEQELGMKMYEVMKEKLSNRDIKVVAQEPSLWFTSPSGNGYAGSTDLICEYEGTLIIADYKNSRKSKRKEWISDYILQTAAYTLAHNQMYNTNIQSARIWLVTHNMEFQEFIITPEEMKAAQREWFVRCRQYFN